MFNKNDDFDRFDLNDDFEFDDYTFTENNKPANRNIFQWFLLFLAVVFIILSLLIFFYQSEIKVFASSDENCKSLVLEKRIIGVETTLECQFETIFGFNNYFLNYNNYKTVKDDISTKENLLILENQEKNSAISQNIKKLQAIGISTLPLANKETENLAENLAIKNDYLKKLDELLVKNLYKIKDLESIFAKTVELNPEIKNSEFDNLFKDYEILSDENKILLYPSLFDSYLKMKSKIILSLSSQKVENGDYLEFDGLGFKNIYDKIPRIGNDFDEQLYPITNSLEIDNFIRESAKKRGYVLQGRLNKENLANLDQDGLVVQVSQDFKKMQIEAAKENVVLNLTSTYRSPEQQQALFMERLVKIFEFKTKTTFEPEKLNTKQGMEIIEEVLKMTAPPGYSRHHSGYTIDVASSTPVFAESPGFAWISKNNYKNAKKFGFIPSYPDNAGMQGPEPEEWEYVWIGTEILQKSTETAEK
jgi:D-alanyl-D-alanine carboxypeptidase